MCCLFLVIDLLLKVVRNSTSPIKMNLHRYFIVLLNVMKEAGQFCPASFLSNLIFHVINDALIQPSNAI